MREERSDLRAKLFVLERERNSMEFVISSQQAQEMALRSHIKLLQGDLESLDSEVHMN